MATEGGYKLQYEQEKEKREQLEVELENLKSTSVPVSDHTAALDNLRQELSESDSAQLKQQIEQNKELIKLGEQAIYLAQRSVILSYTYYAQLNSIKRHSVIAKVKEIKGNRDLASLSKLADAYWDLSDKRECTQKYKESLVDASEFHRNMTE